MTWSALHPTHAHIVTKHHKFDGRFDGPFVDVRDDEPGASGPVVVVEFHDPFGPKAGPVCRIAMDPQTALWLALTIDKAAKVAREHHTSG